jgi:hypothetical protein
VKNPDYALSRKEANRRRKLVLTPSMRRPVGVKWILDCVGASLGFSLAELTTVATLPSAPYDERFVARCKLGVLVSAGGATC